ncbi:hypothetical protein JYU34_014019 [Plutella xylostella]|uniref:Acyltransferase 3 domain-containing protein n=1 Tax=Plutella xylostella TaxID=51655 RepID=A0ABQ7Q7J2_PLUXY|nr:hypothetical protein JYU34_014019 [Plutella xylostella]
MWCFPVIVLVLLVPWSSAVIYKLNDSEYLRMPPLYALDDYPACMARGGVYCLADVDLYTDQPSELMTLILEFSADTLKHFNHTQAHRGVCLQKSCKKYLNESRDLQEGTADLNATLEACLNESFWDQYELQAKLANVNYCLQAGEKLKIDISDAVMAVVYLIFILFNVIGSFYDVLKCKKGDKCGNPYLLSFSLRRNWARLTAPATRGQDERLDRLKLFNGLRTMTMICVFFSHTSLVLAFSYVDNPQYIETAYDDPVKQILFNGSLVTHTFFVMSSFLLAYNLQMYRETHTVSWVQWPKGMLMRWLRLTPVYAFMLASVSTWNRHIGSGPLWPLVVGSEAAACRRYWWAHLLYVNNYVYDDALCAPSTWYLAADTQLFCIGLLVCVLARTPRAQRIALGLLFLVSLVIPMAHTIVQDLDPVVMQAPEKYRNLYASDATFRLLYVRGHTNLSTYTLGLAGGFLAYHWQRAGVDLAQYRKLRYPFWLVFPAGVAIILSGGLFYGDGQQTPAVYRVLYATLYKPVFQFIVVFFIIGCIFKLESTYRGIVEWRGFTWMGRASYCAFLLHTVFQRGLYGSQLAPTHMSDYAIVTVLSATIFLSFFAAVPLYLFVEAPIAQLTKAAMAPKPRHFENNMAAAAEAGDTHGQSKL